jgi:hypothetical protein
MVLDIMDCKKFDNHDLVYYGIYLEAYKSMGQRNRNI